MSGVCLACLAGLADGADASGYHTSCVRAVFGTTAVPTLDLDLAKLHTVALAMVGRTALSGVQRKISLRLADTPRRLQVATADAQFILKPQTQTFPALPENEHVTMRIAARAGIEIPPCALISLTDGTLAYLVQRFDRPRNGGNGGKLHQEDFCQLAVKSPKQKYEGSAELCVKLVLRYTTSPLVETKKLFRLLAVTWWTGNGDMHLKNFSLLRGADTRYRMSPAYDLVCTRLVIEGDRLALPIGGGDLDVSRRQWLDLAKRCELTPRVAGQVLHEVSGATEDAVALVDRSFLPAAMKARYVALLRDRGAALHLAATGSHDQS